MRRNAVQIPNAKYKPKTVIADCEHVSQEPFRKHTEATVQRYGSVVGVNLVNQHGTEELLSRDYRKLTSLYEKELKVQLVVFDFHKECGAANYQYAPAKRAFAIGMSHPVILLTTLNETF